MLGLVIFGVVVWVIVQTSTGKNQMKWRGRFQAPLAVRVRDDAVAVARQVRAYVEYRLAKRRTNWDNPEVF